MDKRLSWIFLGALCLGAAACGASGDSGDSGFGNVAGGGGLSPAGVQDFGYFKDILQRGELPGPDALDQVGFFAEHKIGEPPTDCGEALCARTQLGSMANLISGSNCTLVHLSLGTALDPRTLPRPALDVAVAVGVREAPLRRRELSLALAQLLDELAPEDTVTLTGDGVAELRVGAAERPALRARLLDLPYGTRGSVYDSARAAVDALGAAAPGRHRRVILLSDGRVEGVGPARVERLLRGFAEGGGGITVVALSSDRPAGALEALSEAGAGAFYQAAGFGELPTLFSREVAYSLIPVATQVAVRVQPGAAYRLREVFGIGARSWSLSADGGRIDLPALFLAWRKEVTGSDANRRGGGGGIFLEVLPQPTPSGVTLPVRVADVALSYQVPATGERKQLQAQVVSADPPGQAPPDGRFGAPAVEKGFVVLNLYVALRMAAERSAAGDLRGAYEILSTVEHSAAAWEQRHDDAEIRADLTYVRLFLGNLAQKGATQQPPRARWFLEPWPRD